MVRSLRPAPTPSGPLLQSGSYGSALMLDLLSFTTLSASTSFAIPPAPLAVFSSYLIDGEQYMMHFDAGGGATKFTIPPRGREIVRPGSGGAGDAPEIVAGVRGLLVDPAAPRREELEEFAAGDPRAVWDWYSVSK